jgi:hypothetical protein
MESLHERTYRLVRQPKVNDICVSGKEFVKSIDAFAGAFFNVIAEDEKVEIATIIDSVEKYINKLKEVYRL